MRDLFSVSKIGAEMPAKTLDNVQPIGYTDFIRETVSGSTERNGNGTRYGQ
jgi:hypothetical protein